MEWTLGQTDRWTDGWMEGDRGLGWDRDGQMDGWTDRQMGVIEEDDRGLGWGGQADGRMDIAKDRQSDRQT